MVFAYALLKVEGKKEEATAILEQADYIVVPDSFRAEFANVVWQWVRAKEIVEDFAYSALQDVEVLIDEVVCSEEIWRSALQLSITMNHPVYDSLFVAAAMLYDTRVVTYDLKMQSKFPAYVLSAQDFLGTTEEE